MKLAAALVLQERLFNRVVIGCVALGFAVLVALGVFGLDVMRRNIGFTDRVSHTYEVQKALGDFRILNERSETARRGYLLSHDDTFRATYDAAAGALAPSLEKVRRLTIDNPVQQANVLRLQALMRQQSAAAQKTLRDAQTGILDGGSNFRDDGAVLATRNIRSLSAAMAAEEQRLLGLRAEDRLRSIHNLLLVAIAAGVILTLVATGSIWVILRYTRDLTASRDQLRRLNAGLEDTVRARTADLRRANDEIQRFAYIVSHDLRSPLVNVMGFTSELEAAIAPLSDMLDAALEQAPQVVSVEARDAVRNDLPEAVGFIRTSTQKMDRLINAILKLSREGRRVLAPEPIAMAGLLEGVAANLRHRTDELGASIEIGNVPELVSDRLALEQIFSNLLENALKYLKPGRPGRILVSGRQQDGRVIYEVADNGRGIDPKDHDRIFDLFRRSGVQDQPGEGIGLAHVRALTYRLGGVIDCQSVLDQGATFRVSLPQHLAEGTAA
jgi:signal transduction histidine kinase